MSTSIKCQITVAREQQQNRTFGQHLVGNCAKQNRLMAEMVPCPIREGLLGSCPSHFHRRVDPYLLHLRSFLPAYVAPSRYQQLDLGPTEALTALLPWLTKLHNPGIQHQNSENSNICINNPYPPLLTLRLMPGQPRCREQISFVLSLPASDEDDLSLQTTWQQPISTQSILNRLWVGEFAKLFHKEEHPLLSVAEGATAYRIKWKSKPESLSTQTIATSGNKCSCTTLYAGLLTRLYLYARGGGRGEPHKNKYWKSNHSRFDTFSPVVHTN